MLLPPRPFSCNHGAQLFAELPVNNLRKATRQVSPIVAPLQLAPRPYRIIPISAPFATLFLLLRDLARSIRTLPPCRWLHATTHCRFLCHRPSFTSDTHASAPSSSRAAGPCSGRFLASLFIINVVWRRLRNFHRRLRLCHRRNFHRRRRLCRWRTRASPRRRWRRAFKRFWCVSWNSTCAE